MANQFSNGELLQLRTSIEAMDRSNHLEILKIMVTHQKTSFCSETKHGTYINLTDLPQDTLQAIHQYVQLVIVREEELNRGEREMDKCKSMLSNENS